MIAELWGKVIIEGKKSFEDVPRQLKERVREYLIQCGKINLIK